jgi:hypothetical protein
MSAPECRNSCSSPPRYMSEIVWAIRPPYLAQLPHWSHPVEDGGNYLCIATGVDDGRWPRYGYVASARAGPAAENATAFFPVAKASPPVGGGPVQDPASCGVLYASMAERQLSAQGNEARTVHGPPFAKLSGDHVGSLHKLAVSSMIGTRLDVVECPPAASGERSSKPGPYGSQLVCRTAVQINKEHLPSNQIIGAALHKINNCIADAAETGACCKILPAPCSFVDNDRMCSDRQRPDRPKECIANARFRRNVLEAMCFR